jgi:hypothetical protein
MVPGKAALEAESVLDKEIFNREIEAQWWISKPWSQD